MLPELEMATSQQVADFYGVNMDVIRQLVKSYRVEIESDGYATKTGKEVMGFLSDNKSLKKISTTQGRKTVTLDDGFRFEIAKEVYGTVTI